jgi:uncharacterized membrane protein (DUF485 family)
MKLPRYLVLYNVVLFQVLWFTAVLGANQYLFGVVLLLALHLYWCTNWRAELFLLLTGATAGIVCDSILAMAGVYVFASGTQTLPIPWWLIGLWLGFAATLRHSMAPLMKKPVWGAVNAAYVFALSQFLMTFVMAAMYVRRSRQWDRMESELLASLGFTSAH